MRFRIRPPTPSDRAFVASAWARGAHEHYYAGVPRAEFRRGFDALMDRAFARADVSLLCDAAAPDGLFGFIVYEPGKLHWIYVKGPFRRLGKARELLDFAFGDAQITTRWRTERLGRPAVWDPFAFD